MTSGSRYAAVRLPLSDTWPSDVSVWHVRMPRLLPGTLHLDSAEQQRAARYRRMEDRVRFAVTRSALRELLGVRLGIDPQAVRFAVSHHGRPELADAPALSFNVSHAGEHALIAMSNVRRVGVDIERIDAAVDWRALLDIVCTKEEQDKLARMQSTLQRDAFFRCWTAKEALLKTLGVGIIDGMVALAVDGEMGALKAPVVSDTRPGDAHGLQFDWLPWVAGYSACLAFGTQLNVARYQAAIESNETCGTPRCASISR